MTASAPRHAPVMVAEVLAHWLSDPSGKYVDGTAGQGAHGGELLSRLDPGGRLLAIYRDAGAVEDARRNLAAFGDRVRFRVARFSALSEVAREDGFSGA